MASIILKWLRRCLFICVCAFFLMSHNASALDFSVDVDLVSNSASQIYPIAWNCGASVCNGFQNAWTGFLTTTDGGLLNYRHSIPNRQYSYGDIIRLSYNVSSTRDTSANHTSFAGLKYAGNHPVSVLYTDVSQLNDSGGVVYVYLWVYGSFRDSDLLLTSVDGGFTWYLYTGSSGTAESLKILDTQVFRLKNGSTDYSSALNTINNNINNINNNLNNVKDAIDNQHQEETDATQDAADEAGDSGDQSAADAENATAGLISVIGGFVNAITSASPSDCKINGKINNSFNMGELDLCSMPVPPFVQIISSLILIAICIPFAIIMFNRFIGLFRSFQG